jgi:hypothetical protein
MYNGSKRMLTYSAASSDLIDGANSIEVVITIPSGTSTQSTSITYRTQSAAFLKASDLGLMRAVHMTGNWGPNMTSVLNPPSEYFSFLKNLRANWVGISVALHADNSMDSTVEMKYSGVSIPTFTDNALRQTIRSLRQNGFNVYLTLAFTDEDAKRASRPYYRWQLGRPFIPGSNVSSENWPWLPTHPSHQRFVKTFFETYTQCAVHFAKICQDENVALYSLGTETDGLFITRSGGSWPTHYRNHLQAMVDSVRTHYGGLLTYDLDYHSVMYLSANSPALDYVWEDLNLDVVGISAYFPLASTIPTAVISVDSLKKSWERTFRDYIIPYQSLHPSKPLVFLEFGYLDLVGSPYDASSNYGISKTYQDLNGNGIDDGEETQANVYSGFFSTNEKFGNVVQGAFLWENQMASNQQVQTSFLANNRSMSIRQKTAESVVRSVYSNYARSLRLSSSTLQFGYVNINTSKELTFSVRNTGSDTLLITSVTANESAFTFGTTSATVMPGSTVVNIVRFSPTKLGIVAGTVLIWSNAYTSPDTIKVSGVGVGTASILLQPKTVSFGNVVYGQFKDTTISITNPGTDTLKLHFANASTGFSARPLALNIPPNQTAKDTLRFSPAGFGLINGKIITSHNAPSGSDTLVVMGTALGVAPVLKSPADSAINLPLNPTLTWDPIPGASFYGFQLAASQAFTSVLTEDSTLTATSKSAGALSLGTTYYWRVRTKVGASFGPFSSARQFKTIRTTSVEQVSSDIPREFGLSQNYPNPFNPSTTISFALPKSSDVTLKIYDLLGKEVAELVSQDLPPGHFSVRWQADVPSGIYIYRLQAGTFVSAKKMMLLH